MIRPAPTSGVLLSAAAFAFLFVAAPSSARPPYIEPAALADEATPPPPPVVTTTTDAPAKAPPPLDPLEMPPAFDTSEAGGFLWSFLKSMFMLGVVVALIYLVLHKGLGRLVQRTQMGRRMRVLERIALDQRRALYLVEVDGQEVLLAGGDGAVTPVELRPKRAPPTTPAAPSASFQDELQKSGGRPAESGKDDDGRSLVQTASERARERSEG